VNKNEKGKKKAGILSNPLDIAGLEMRRGTVGTFSQRTVGNTDLGSMVF